MKFKSLSGMFCAVGVLLTVSGKEVFHFNFKGCNGKTTLRDRAFTLTSERKPLLEQQGALRLAPTAEISITGNLPSLRRQFTAAAWILNKRDIDLSSILSRGSWGTLQQFVFTAGPEFYTRQGKWKTCGIRTGNKLKCSGVWKHITGVFDSGVWKLYVDGKLYAALKTPLKELPTQNEPLIVGAQKDAFKRMNWNNADMLLNDLHLYDHALTDAEISALYQKERSSYPAGSLIPPGKTVRHALENCFHYAKDGYDPDFKKQMKITRSWKAPAPMRIASATVRKTSASAPAKLLINGKEQLPYMAFLSAFINHDRYELAQIPQASRDFGAAGIRLVRFSTQVWHPYMGTVWQGPGKYDFSIAERQLKAVLDGNPGAAVEICISLNEAPPWFNKQYPDELEQNMMPNGKLRPSRAGGEIGSDVWKKLTERYVFDFITHMENSPCADRIFGYNVCGGRSHEWYWPGTFTQGVPGYSKATAKAYAAWRKARNLPPAPVPLPEERQYSETLLLRDPQKAAPVLEFRRFLNDRTYQCLKDLVLTARKALKKPKLVGTYSGYSFNNEVKNHIGGLNIFSRAARLSACDYVQLAVVYGEQRMPGNAGLSVNPYNASAMLHGKLFWFESDMRTALVPNLSEKEQENRFDTVEATAAALERNFAVAFTRGSGLYEMTLNGLATYHHDTILDAVKRNVETGKQILTATRNSAAETAVFFDENSALYHAWPNAKNQRFFRSLFNNFYCNHPKAGIPVDFYTLEDIDSPEMRDYKLYIFLNAIDINAETARRIRVRADRNGATVLWCYAPGFIANGKFDSQNMEKVTGIPFAVSMKSTGISAVSGKDSKLFKRPVKFPYYTCQPVFTPTGADLTVHAAANGKPVIAEKRVSRHRAVYSLLPPDAVFLRNLAASAGVHIYLQTPDVLSADSGHLFVHAASSGTKNISLPQACDVIELPGGKCLFKNVKNFRVNMKKHENKFYKLIRK